MAEEYRAERPHQIGNGEPAEGEQQGLRAAAVEDAAQDRRDVEVEGEVIPFDEKAAITSEPRDTGWAEDAIGLADA